MSNRTDTVQILYMYMYIHINYGIQYQTHILFFFYPPSFGVKFFFFFKGIQNAFGGEREGKQFGDIRELKKKNHASVDDRQEFNKFLGM